MVCFDGVGVDGWIDNWNSFVEGTFEIGIDVCVLYCEGNETCAGVFMALNWVSEQYHNLSDTHGQNQAVVVV